MKKAKRVLAFLFACILVLQYIPATAFASSATVTVAAKHTAGTVNVDGTLNETEWDFYTDLGVKIGETAPSGKVAALWKADALFVAISHSGADAAEIKLAGKTVVVDLADGTVSGDIATATAAVTAQTAEVMIPLAGAEVALADYNQTADFNVVLTSGEDASAKLANETGKIQFSLDHGEQYFLFEKSVLNSAMDGFSVDEQTGVATLNENVTADKYMWTNEFDVAHSTSDYFMEQTICVYELPETEPTYISASGYATGLAFMLGDRHNTPENGWISGLVGSLHNVDGKVVLCVTNTDGGTPVDLGVTLGETFVLGTQWNTDDTVDVYVNGVYLKTVENGTLDMYWTMNYDGIMYYYAPNSIAAGQAHVTFADIAVYMGTYASVAKEIKPEVLLADINLAAVEGDIVLPTSFETAALGEIAISWSSSNTDIISNAGAVTRPEDADAEVILTASVGSKELWSVTAIVKKVVPVMTGPSIVAAKHAGDGVVVNGIADEAAWSNFEGLSVKSGEDEMSGTTAALWTKDYLYVAVNHNNASSVSVEVEGKTVNVDASNASVSGDVSNAVAAVNGNTLEIAIPLSAVGIALTDYNEKVAFNVVLTSANGGEAKLAYEGCELQLTLDHGELVFALDGTAVNNYGGFSFNEETGVITLNQDVANDLWLQTYNIAVDHASADFYMEQSICINALPASTPSYVPGPGGYATGLAIMLGDRDNEPAGHVSTMLCTLHNVDGEIQLCVANADGGSPVALGVNLRETFILGTQWNRDNTVDIYVNGIYLQTVENGTLDMAGTMQSGVMYYYIANSSDGTVSLQGKADVTISNVTVNNGTYAKLANEITKEALLWNVDLTAVRNDITLPNTYSSLYLGDIAITWSSSNTKVIGTNGVVTRPTNADEDVVLTAKVGNTTLWSVTATVKKAEAVQKDIVTAVHTMTGTEGINWNYTNAFSGDSGAPTGSLGAMWDKDNLYLSVEFNNATQLLIEANGKSISVDLSAASSDDGVNVEIADSIAVVTIPMSVINTRLTDYNQVIDFQAALSNANGSSTVAEDGQGKVQFIIDSIELYALTLDGQPYVQGDSRPGAVNGFEISDGKAVLETSGTDELWLQTKKIEDVIDHSKNMLLEQTLYIEELPVTEAKFYQAVGGNGYNFYLIDFVPNINNLASYGQLVFCSLHNVGDGKLSLVVSGGSASKIQVVDLGVSVGDTFTLGTLWSADDSFSVYVNGDLKATVSNIGFEAAYYGADIMSIGYKALEAGTAKLTVSDITISGPGFSSLAEEITPNAIFGSEIPTSLEDNIVLPTTFESAYLGTVDLTWTSSNDELLTNDGIVTRPSGNEGVQVTLTLSVNGNELWKLTPTIKAKDTASPAFISAAFTESAVTLDGSISEEGWVLNSSVLDDGTTVGKFGVQWQLNKLLLAIDTADINAVQIMINDAVIDLSSSQIQVATLGTISEIAIPMTVLGVTPNDYGITFPVNVSIGEGRYDGEIELSSIDWFSTDNAEHRVATIIDVERGTENQGVQTLANGYYIYDHYDEGGNNPADASPYVYFRYPKADNTQPTTVPLWPVDETYYFSFDFQATSMPVYSSTAAGPDIRVSNYGVNWYISGHRDGVSSSLPSDCVLFGIYNSNNGLMFVVSGADSLEIIPLNKQVGDLFRIGVATDPDGNMTLFVDGKKIQTFSNVEKRLSGMCTYNEDGCVNFEVFRNGQPATSAADNFDVYMTNYAFGLYYGDSILDSLNFEDIAGENTDQYGVTSDLTLPGTVSNDQITDPVAVTWSSSDETVISDDGKVTPPAVGGKLVTLTATANNRQKQFNIYVKGESAADSVLIATNDTAPYKTAGVVVDTYEFTLDDSNNSIIYNLGTVQNVNVIELTDGDNIARLSTEVLKLYVSNDNASYTQIDEFKLLHKDNKWYIYDFNATAQYVKVHCTHYNGSEADFTGILSEMIVAYYQDVFGAEGEYSNSHTVTVSNTNNSVSYDDCWTISKSAAGVTGTDSSIRVYQGDELLYHYVEGENIVVRIPVVAAGDSVSLTVLSGNESAMDISNKEYVHEIVYGTREAYYVNRLAKIFALPNGTIINIDCTSDATALCTRRSYDGGQTWTAIETIEASVGWINNASGYLYDSLTGRIIFQGYDTTISTLPTRTIYSDDNGVTWHKGVEITNMGCNYVNGLELSTNDGDGPNVDFLLSVCTSTVEHGSDVNHASVAYSTDGGDTWQLSESKIMVANAGEGIEAGVSESSMYELDDGTVVMIARCQKPGNNNFAISYSRDHGITWQENVDMTSIYTVNTQPVIHEFDDLPFLLWSGNNVLGGTSYRRTPLSIAYSTDDMETFENIQDLYVKYSLQGLDTATQNQCTNPNITHVGDDVLITWFNNFIEMLYMRVENFDDYFYKTKGAYDSFEGKTTKYEGWSTIHGIASLSTAQASDGSYSMKFDEDTAAARSVPYFQDGIISMDMYLNSANESFTIYLQSAFSNDTTATPIVLNCVNGNLCGFNMQAGWNTIYMDFELTSGNATISVNGGTPTNLTVDTDIGDYICFVRINTGSTTVMYLDDFTVIDEISLEIPVEGTGDDNQNDLDGFAVEKLAVDASVTAPVGGWKEGSNTFTVSAEDACAVAVSNDGGQTYIRLQATTTETENTYSFTVDNVSADTKIIVMLKGDANGDGKISVADRLILNRALMDETEPAYAALNTIGAVACDMNGDGVITVVDRLALHRALLDADNSAYAAPDWDE